MRCSSGRRRSGVVVDNHVTVTDPAILRCGWHPPPLRAANARVRELHMLLQPESVAPACPGLVFSASPNDIAHPLMSCPPAKQRSCHDAAKACSACELGPVTRGVSSRRWAAGKRPCRVSGSPVREAWGRPGAGGDHHQVPLTGADREGSGVGLLKHAQHVGHLLAVTRSWPPADHHPLADIGRGEPDYQPVPHAGHLPPGGGSGCRAAGHRPTADAATIRYLTHGHGGVTGW